jgi:hypothetical protein
LSVRFDSVFDMEGQVTPVAGSPVVGALGAAAAAVAEVQGRAVFGLGDADLEAAIEACQALAARVFDATLTLVREADERDLGRRLGGSSSAAWLSGRFRIRPGQARALVRLANRTGPDDGPVDYSANVRAAPTGRELRATGAALAAGAISAEHVAVVGKIMERVPPAVTAEQAATAEAELAGFCAQYEPGTVAKLGDYLLAVMAADTLDDAEAERHRRRSLRLNETTGGISGTLTSEGIAVLRTALDPLAAPNPADDGSKDPRSPGQRLVDALIELARRAIAADTFEHNHGISHRVLVTIGLNTLTAEHLHPSDRSPNGTGEEDTSGIGTSDTGGESGRSGGVTGRTLGGDGAALPTFTGGNSAPGEIQWGGLISPAAARRIACCAGIQRVVLDPNGAVLDVGREHRTATPAQFAALTARDGGCAFPGCTRPAAWCIAHVLVLYLLEYTTWQMSGTPAPRRSTAA